MKQQIRSTAASLQSIVYTIVLLTRNCRYLPLTFTSFQSQHHVIASVYGSVNGFIGILTHVPVDRLWSLLYNSEKQSQKYK